MEKLETELAIKQRYGCTYTDNLSKCPSLCKRPPSFLTREFHVPWALNRENTVISHSK